MRTVVLTVLVVRMWRLACPIRHRGNTVRMGGAVPRAVRHGDRQAARALTQGPGRPGRSGQRGDTSLRMIQRSRWPAWAVVGPARWKPWASNSSTVPTYPEITSTRVPPVSTG